MISSSCRWIRLASQAARVAVLSLLLMTAIPVCAQDAVPAPPAAPVSAPTFSRPLYLEWGITVAMIGLAMFAVCRRSQRH